MPEPSLTDLLDDWHSILVDMGSRAVDLLGPGLDDRAIARMEEKLGFEFLPELKELLAWGTAQHPCAPSFFPSLVFESLLSPARMVQETQRSQEYMWRDLYEHAENALGSNTDFVIIAAEVGVIAIDHHRPGPTCGGIWHVDEGIATWAAKDLPSLVRSCIGMADHGLLKTNERGVINKDRDAFIHFAATLKTEFEGTSPHDHLFTRSPEEIALLIFFRWPTLDIPDIWTTRPHE